MKTFLKKIFARMGYRISQINPHGISSQYYDLTEEDFHRIYNFCKPYTMTPLERVYALYKAVKYIEDATIPGDIVECGVWRGGSQMVSARMLLNLGTVERSLYLYDTYEGMPKPSKRDILSFNNTPAYSEWKKHADRGEKWFSATLLEVQQNLAATGYPAERMRFVKGKVEDTIPAIIPEKISILRMDLDWYEPTLHSLVHLFPRLSVGGVLILDDYGFWRGEKEAVDEYFSRERIPMLLIRTDDGGGRISIKTALSRSQSAES